MERPYMHHRGWESHVQLLRKTFRGTFVDGRSRCPLDLLAVPGKRFQVRWIFSFFARMGEGFARATAGSDGGFVEAFGPVYMYLHISLR
jgi:hypothetical protein